MSNHLIRKHYQTATNTHFNVWEYLTSGKLLPNIFLFQSTFSLTFEFMLIAKAYRWFYFYFFYQMKPGMLLLKQP